jgi:hypothetical protein
MDFDAVELPPTFKAQSQVELARVRNGDNSLSLPAVAKSRRSRRYVRYRFDVRIHVSVFREGRTVACWGRTSELGQDGLGATLSGCLQNDEVVTLEFPIPIEPHRMRLRAVVRYSDGLRCGFEFLVLTQEQKNRMHHLCVILANAS